MRDAWERAGAAWERAGDAVARVFRSMQEWTPRRPRLAGALLGLGAALMLVGCGLVGVVLGDDWELAKLLLIVASVVVILDLPLILVPTEKQMLVILPCLIVLLVSVLVGFRDSVLSLRGERTPVTVTEVTSFRKPITGGDDHTCGLRLPDGRRTSVTGTKVCTAYTRVGDRIHVYADPHGLVAPTGTAPVITFPVLGTVVGTATLLLVVAASRTMGQRRRTPG
ncbi:hypothetical protein [Streptomyces sp. ML-6]|uniref:hypothetical protein n=1 Tax=Streptomyces sp. ML-6 TaxID=2982693 RepID=UPI0024BF2CFE|nr:hypothetical protein [Streptomyces sp. ML-6]MDK0519183.1 hypothetical protein [Streptomyces sp. ML-6]